MLNVEESRRFALRSVDRILAEAWKPEIGLEHVVAYSDAEAAHRGATGFLDDYAFTAIACLDAYESTCDLSYFRAARQITDQMIERFYDSTSGGFFDSRPTPSQLGVLSTARKPFQDSPTPAGNPMAVIALIRMHSYTEESAYREKAEQTMGLLAGVAGQYGIFAATYGIAGMYLSAPHTRIVVVGDDDLASQLYSEATAVPHSGRSVLKLTFSQTAEENLPPALAATIPKLSEVKESRTVAVVCSGFSCGPPAHNAEELKTLLQEGESAA